MSAWYESLLFEVYLATAQDDSRRRFAMPHRQASGWEVELGSG